MPDRRLNDLIGIVGANPQLPWGDFECTPVIEYDAAERVLNSATRCAITAGGMTVVLRLPQPVVIGTAASWPPKAVLEKMMEAVGPALPA